MACKAQILRNKSLYKTEKLFILHAHAGLGIGNRPPVQSSSMTLPNVPGLISFVNLLFFHSYEAVIFFACQIRGQQYPCLLALYLSNNPA